MNVANLAEGIGIGLVAGGGLVLYFKSNVATVLNAIEMRLKNIEVAVIGKKAS